jgi:hypothetical protein
VGYAAPELFHGRSESRSDVYSLAATAYHLLTDDDPRDHPMQYPQLDTLHPALADLVRSALAEDLADRPAAAEFRQQLEAYLGGLTGPLRALTFPDGDAADERDELLQLSIRHWNYAAGILHDGTLAHWLRRTLHDPVAAQAAEAAVRRWPDSPNAALDEFIRQLDPEALPPGKLELRTGSIRLLEVGPNQQVVRHIDVANRGRGYLRGEAFSTQPWARVAGDFACPPSRVCAVPVEIDTTGLAPGRAHLAAITLAPIGGPPEVVAVEVLVGATGAAPVRITLTSPAIDVRPKVVDFGGISRQDTATARLTVTNTSQTMAQVRVRGAPRWLQVKPATFGLVAGARQVVKLTARPGRLRGEHRNKLVFALDGGQDQEVQVKIKVKRGGLFGW